MVSSKQKKEMLDYLTAGLEESHDAVIPRNRELVNGITSNYILVDKKGLVFLVDQTYPNKGLEEVYTRALNNKMLLTFVLFKDGKTFFRSASKDKRYKKDYGLSLKNYSDEELNRMILFRPEEEFIFRMIRSRLQYYQQLSARLSQGIVSYVFEPVVFDYDHLPEEQRFMNRTEESKKIRIWRHIKFNSGKLKLERGLLV